MVALWGKIPSITTIQEIDYKMWSLWKKAHFHWEILNKAVFLESFAELWMNTCRHRLCNCYPFHIFTQLLLSHHSASRMSILAYKLPEMYSGEGDTWKSVNIYPHLDLNESQIRLYVFTQICIYLGRKQKEFFLWKKMGGVLYKTYATEKT